MLDKATDDDEWHYQKSAFDHPGVVGGHVFQALVRGGVLYYKGKLSCIPVSPTNYY